MWQQFGDCDWAESAYNSIRINELDIDCTSGFGFTNVHFAARHGHIQLMQELVNRGADIEKTDLANMTALHFAAFFNQAEMCTYILNHVSTSMLFKTNAFDQTPIEMASNVNGCFDILKSYQQNFIMEMGFKRVHIDSSDDEEDNV